jgi:hypothetical protein
MKEFILLTSAGLLLIALAVQVSMNTRQNCGLRFSQVCTDSTTIAHQYDKTSN